MMNILPEVSYTANELQDEQKKNCLLEVKNLSLTIERYEKGFSPHRMYVIRDFHLSVEEGEIVAIVGASGSGKSLLADTILGIHPKNSFVKGKINYQNKPLTEKRKKQLRGKEIMLIPQMTNALDPLMKVGRQVKSFIKQHHKREILEDVFQKVGLDKDVMNHIPSTLSGGMIRRVFIAMALASEAKLIIADEPTNGLDPYSLNEMLSHFKVLADYHKGIILITHDIEAALKIADKIAVFYAGETVEVVKKQYFSGKGEHLRHPYTKALWNALPQNEFKPIKNVQPLPSEDLKGCLFSEQCSRATEVCKRKKPELRMVNKNEMVRCFYA